jgi:hypothetical protein
VKGQRKAPGWKICKIVKNIEKPRLQPGKNHRLFRTAFLKTVRASSAGNAVLNTVGTTMEPKALHNSGIKVFYVF